MKKIKWSALITMIVSLLISIVSGYCTVVGMGNVFISAASVTMFIASVIELGRVVLIYDLHHYWDKMKLYQKIPGVCMLLVAITLSAMGIFGFMSNAHSQRTQEIIPIEMEIKQKQTEIKILNDAILINNQQLNQFNNKALDKYTEMGYVTKAVNLQKEQQKITDKLYDDNRQKQNEITKLNQEILNLQLTAEQKAPTLAHLKYYAKLFNVDNDTAIIIFIVMISFIIFNAGTMKEAFTNISGLFGANSTCIINDYTIYYLRSYLITIIIAIIGATPILKNTIGALKTKPVMNKIINILEPITIVIILLIVTAYLVDNSYNPFLYFRF